jgi:hypothetical protein
MSTRKSIFFLTLASAGFLSAQDITHGVHMFRPGEALTAASGSTSQAIATDFLRSQATTLNLRPEALDGVYLYKEYQTAHNGVTHLIYHQRFQQMDVENAEWVVNVDRDGRVINSGGLLFNPPQPGTALPEVTSAMKAVRAAATAVNEKAGRAFQPFQKGASFDGRTLRFEGGRFTGDIPGQLLWYGVRDTVRPAWKFQLIDTDGISPYIAVVDGAGEQVLRKQSLLLGQSAAKPQGLVYELNPIPNPRPGYPREGTPAFADRKIVSFSGDPAASPRGWMTGNETAGNNTITGANPLGISCNVGFDNCPPRPKTVTSDSLDFSFPLEMGVGAPEPTYFAAASGTNLFYLVNRAHDLFYSLGFDEAAGNYQSDNFGKGGVGGDPVYAYSQFGVAAPGSPSLNNAAFSSVEDDGIPGRMLMYINPGIGGQMPGFFTDGSLDAEVVFHEYTHGVSRRLARQMYLTYQGGSMGEALSDFFALEFTVAEGAPAGGIYPFGEYLFFQIGAGIRTRPYSTNTEINPLTYAQLGKVIPQPEVHADGEIFMEALWEVRANLIQQLGEKEGRRRVRLIVVDGMKLAPPRASMLDMRDAILLADQVDFHGESQKQIWAGFAKRGMGVLAQTGSGDSAHISANYDLPSPTGSLKFYEEKYVIGETVRLVLQDANYTKPTATVQVLATSGDLQQVTLRKQGFVYTGAITTRYTPAARGSGFLGLIPGDTITAYYNDADTGQGPKQVETSAATSPDYAGFFAAPSFRFANEQALRLRSQLASTAVPLPFEFPFFEQKYSEVRVYSNGILVFGQRDFTPCNDIASFRLLPAVAPMWMDMRTNGFAQPNEDVYMTTGSNSVTFRWAAETNPVSLFQDPDPLNFAATLFADGRIVFQYGGGNMNLAAGGQGGGLGCPTTTVTVGLSNGHETFVQLPGTHDGAGTLEDAPVIIWEPPYANLGGPVAELELPKAGENAEGIIIVQGIAYDADPGARLRRIDILIDGRAITTAAFGLPRTDYCAQNRLTQCPGVGFRRVLDPTLLNIAPGTHTIQLRATNQRGVMYTFPEESRTFTVAPGPANLPTGAIESPASGAEVSGAITVRGYAGAVNLLISGVDVLIDGITYGRALYGSSRADICASFAAAGCPGIGFTFSLDTRSGSIPVSNGSHTLQIRVQDESGRYTLLPEKPVAFTVKNDKTDPPKGVLVAPTQNQVLSGTVRITGHAWDPDGRITSVRLLIDGFVAATVPYGKPRPDECAALPDVPACPNIGFELDFDTTRLPNGPHTIAILVANDRNILYEFPRIVSDGINVIVKND